MGEFLMHSPVASLHCQRVILIVLDCEIRMPPSAINAEASEVAVVGVGLIM